jgi:hypothetical protein
MLITVTMMATFPEYGKLSLIEFMRTPVFMQSYAIVFWLCSVVYFLQCLFTNTRSIKGFVGAMIVLAGLVSVPQRLFVLNDKSINLFPLALIVASWTLLALVVFFWPLLHQLTSPVIFRHVRPLGWLSGSAFLPGRELELQLRIGNRWIHGLGVAISIALVVPLMSNPSACLYFLTQIAIVIGVVSTLATVRSRGLWLRQPWSRTELFANIERRIWRHMGVALLVLLMGQFVCGVYGGVPLGRVAVGMALLALTFTACTYLGFMQTRGLRWSDALLAIGIGILSVLLAAYAGRASANLNLVIALEGTMAAGTIFLRYWAKQRWADLDWLLCRPTRVA